MKIFLLLIISIFLFTGCSDNKKFIENNLAEIRESLYEGSCDDVKATMICGKREKDYLLNGYATDLIEFGVLTFYLKDIDNYSLESKKYVLTVGTTRYEGDLEKNPFDNTLVADIKKSIGNEEKLSVKLLLGEFVRDIKLHKVNSDWQITEKEVIDIVAKQFKENLKVLIEDGVFKGEVYIKIINDEDEYTSDYYWYVSIISRTGGKLNALISTKTGEILSQNNSL